MKKRGLKAAVINLNHQAICQDDRDNCMPFLDAR